MNHVRFAVASLLSAGAVPLTAAAAMSAAPASLPGHSLLVSRAGLVVFGPPLHANTPCPHLLPLRRGAATTIKRAVEMAMPPFARRLKLDGRNPHVAVASSSRSGFSFVAGGCGRIVWSRSIVASVFLPHVRGASVSQHTFAVGRVRQGWVLWSFIH